MIKSARHWGNSVWFHFLRSKGTSCMMSDLVRPASWIRDVARAVFLLQSCDHSMSNAIALTDIEFEALFSPSCTSRKISSPSATISFNRSRSAVSLEQSCDGQRKTVWEGHPESWMANNSVGDGDLRGTAAFFDPSSLCQQLIWWNRNVHLLLDIPERTFWREWDVVKELAVCMWQAWRVWGNVSWWTREFWCIETKGSWGVWVLKLAFVQLGFQKGLLWTYSTYSVYAYITVP